MRAPTKVNILLGREACLPIITAARTTHRHQTHQIESYLEGKKNTPVLVPSWCISRIDRDQAPSNMAMVIEKYARGREVCWTGSLWSWILNHRIIITKKIWRLFIAITDSRWLRTSLPRYKGEIQISQFLSQITSTKTKVLTKSHLTSFAEITSNTRRGFKARQTWFYLSPPPIKMPTILT